MQNLVILYGKNICFKGSILWMPFYARFCEPFAVAVGHVLSSFIFYAALATIVAAMVPARSWSYTFTMSCMLSVSVVTVTEAVRAYSAGHAADGSVGRWGGGHRSNHLRPIAR